MALTLGCSRSCCFHWATSVALEKNAVSSFTSVQTRAFPMYSTHQWRQAFRRNSLIVDFGIGCKDGVGFLHVARN